jgi:hypothetical protein
MGLKALHQKDFAILDKLSDRGNSVESLLNLELLIHAKRTAIAPFSALCHQPSE